MKGDLYQCGAPRRQIETTPDTSNAQWVGWLADAMRHLGTGSIVVLYGSRGSGKTKIACMLMEEALHRRYSQHDEEWRLRYKCPKYVHVMEFFLSIRAAYQKDASVNETDAIKAFTKPSLLVIDEVHERGETEWEDRMLRHVIDKRYAEMVDTVLIGNKEKDVLMESMGKSVASRIAECGTFIECKGVNWREGKSKEQA